MKTPLVNVPVYDVRLVKSRKPLRVAEARIGNADSAALALHGLVGLTDREHLAVLFLNGSHGITGAHIAAMGGHHGINVEPRCILRAALLACASAMVLGHNHPSGDPSPSGEDLMFTAHVMRAAAIVGVPIVDHVIVTRERGRYYSMMSNGTLPAVES